MSKETLTWLNTMTLIGHTDKRGHAWHYKADEQGSEPNHYAGAVPIEDVYRRLFNFSVDPSAILQRVPVDHFAALDGAHFDGIDDNGACYCYAEIPGKVAWRTSDTHDVLGIFSDGYAGHQYGEWLLESVESILGEGLGIGSAGLLKGRAQAWVSVEVPENVTTPEGVTFRPNLIACTSFDGSLATTYKRVITAVVCDNTLSASLREGGGALKVKHTRNSSVQLKSAREALGIIHQAAADFAADVASLCAETVSDDKWRKLVNELVPVPAATGRARTLATTKQAELYRLWLDDMRVAPWKGTAFGAIQAFNTWEHHIKPVRGATRGERNMVNTITGATEVADRSVLATLARI